MPSDRERDRAWRKAQNAVLKRRIRIQADTHAEIQRLLALALKDIRAALVAAPTDFAAWYLPQLQAEIERALKASGQQTAGVLAAAADQAWAAGVDYLDAPMAAAGVRVPGLLPHLDDSPLAAMRAFMTDRIKDVSASAINKINTELGLTLIGARPMPETLTRVQDILGGASRKRATTIVRTELGRAFSVASDGRARQAADAGVEMDKVWRRSGKRHPRVSHALADGQRVPVDQPFRVGGAKLMHPHDPAAPAAHTINCGCIALYRPRGWASSKPDHKPFTDEELALNPKLADRIEAREEGGAATPAAPAPATKNISPASKKTLDTSADGSNIHSNGAALSQAPATGRPKMKELSTWTHPKTGEQRVYFNLGQGVKVWATQDGATAEFHVRAEYMMSRADKDRLLDQAGDLIGNTMKWDEIIKLAGA